MTAASAAPDATTATTAYIAIPAANPATVLVVNTTTTTTAITNIDTKNKGSYHCEETALCPDKNYDNCRFRLIAPNGFRLIALAPLLPPPRPCHLCWSSNDMPDRGIRLNKVHKENDASSRLIEWLSDWYGLTGFLKLGFMEKVWFSLNF